MPSPLPPGDPLADGPTQPPRAASLGGSVAGALAWWRAAGVDYAFEDAPRGWLKPPAANRAAPASPEPATAQTAPQKTSSQTSTPATPAPQLGGARENWPTSLPAFQAWWLAEPGLDDPELTGFGAGTPRIPPRGPARPQLMVIVPEPEACDSDHLLSGAHGRLLSAILPMLGLAEAEVYIASALPRPVPLADWPALARRGLGELLLHHVALVAPQAIIAFGANVLPLLGHAQPQNTTALPRVNHEGFSSPLLPVGDLAMLLERPAAKARFWQRWLEFSDPSAAGIQG